MLAMSCCQPSISCGCAPAVVDYLTVNFCGSTIGHIYPGPVNIAVLSHPLPHGMAEAEANNIMALALNMLRQPVPDCRYD